jgi:hypothetical protein
MSRGEELRNQLALQMEAAEAVDENLAKRLVQVDRSIKHLKSGEITNKRLLAAFLIQLIEDAETHINILEHEISLENQTAVEQYWYGTLFPRWLQQDDPYFETWKQKLKKQDLPKDDDLLNRMVQQIHAKNGHTWRSFIADFSMKTDLIVSSYYQQKSLCVQLTTLNEQYQEDKYNKWQETLQYWQIPRGLFLSYNPGKTNALNRLVNTALMNSDSCPDGKYKRFDA